MHNRLRRVQTIVVLGMTDPYDVSAVLSPHLRLLGRRKPREI